jgi:hypothetical protein
MLGRGCYSACPGTDNLKNISIMLHFSFEITNLTQMAKHSTHTLYALPPERRLQYNLRLEILPLLSAQSKS